MSTQQAAAQHWTAAMLSKRGVVASVAVYGAFRVALDQAVGTILGRLGADLTWVIGRTSADRLGVVEHLINALTNVHSVVAGSCGGPVGTAVTLVFPLGGPAWAGLVSLQSVVKAFHMMSRLAMVMIPATCNALRPRTYQTGPMTPTLLLVDDSPSFLQVAQQLLERDGLRVVGVAMSCAEAVSKVQALRPQVAVVDIHLGEESGFDLARRLSEEPGQETVVIMTSTHSEDEFADLIASSPVAGFVAKERLSGAAIRLLAS